MLPLWPGISFEYILICQIRGWLLVRVAFQNGIAVTTGRGFQ